MTIATQKEIQVINIICQSDFPYNRFIKISQMIIRRQSDRQEAKRLKIPLTQYKKQKCY